MRWLVEVVLPAGVATSGGAQRHLSLETASDPEDAYRVALSYLRATNRARKGASEGIGANVVPVPGRSDPRITLTVGVA